MVDLCLRFYTVLENPIGKLKVRAIDGGNPQAQHRIPTSVLEDAFEATKHPSVVIQLESLIVKYFLAM